MGKGSCCDNNGLKKGAWNEDEDNKLRAYIQRYGHWNWSLLPKFAGIYMNIYNSMFYIVSKYISLQVGCGTHLLLFVRCSTVHDLFLSICYILLFLIS